MHSCDLDFRAPVSMNSARWLLSPGEGLVYGTNRGDLHVRRPGSVSRSLECCAHDIDSLLDLHYLSSGLSTVIFSFVKAQQIFLGETIWTQWPKTEEMSGHTCVPIGL